jgi:hypothetical protein
MLLLFYPFREKQDFPLFEKRWDFFCEASSSGCLYWDSRRIMQNIQDVENSKKIIPKKDDTSELLIDFEESLIEDDEYDDLNAELGNILGVSEDPNLNDDDIDLMMEELNFHQNGVDSNLLSDNYCGKLNREMKEKHIICDHIASCESVLLN